MLIFFFEFSKILKINFRNLKKYQYFGKFEKKYLAKKRNMVADNREL